MCMEGLRFYDLMRWKNGELLTMEWDIRTGTRYTPGPE